jgi:hypothetical protein
MTTTALRRRLAEVERRLPRRAAGGGGDEDADPYDPELYDWLTVPERETMERHLVAAIEAEQAGRDDLESEALVIAGYARAERRRAGGWPSRWWELADFVLPEGHHPG